MSEQYYGVEPYTGKIICHYRTSGSKNGYSFGKLVDAAKVAKGKLDAAGNYIYDKAQEGISNARNAMNYVADRKNKGVLLSRTKNNLRKVADNAGRLAKNAGYNLKEFGANTLPSVIDKVTGKSKKKNKNAQNARINALTNRGNQYMYENKSLSGKLFKAKRGIKTGLRNVSDAIGNVGSKIGNSVNSLKKNTKNSINNFIGRNITGDAYRNSQRDYVGDLMKKMRENASYKKKNPTKMRQ